MNSGQLPGPTDTDVAIVGAALGGLVAGAILARHRKRVVIFDAADSVGGRGGAVRYGDGYWINFGHREGHDVGDCQLAWHYGAEAAREADVELRLGAIANPLRLHRYPEAEPYFHRAVQLSSANTNQYLYYSLTLLYLGRLQEAEQMARHGVGMQPDGAGYHYALGLVLQQEGKLELARSEFQRELAIDPTSGARRELGQVEEQLKKEPRE